MPAVLWYLPFAVFGLTWLLRFTNGPFTIFRRTRNIFGITYHPVYDSSESVVDWIEEVPEGKFFAELFSCFWCLSTHVSLWLTFLLWLVYRSRLDLDVFVIAWLGAVGISGFLYEMVVRPR